ncbi:MAG: T9SS type A sorting domain-containing protein [Bacteroidota bacterium]
MKALLILILISILEIGAIAQIPNGGFEDWELIQNFEKPIFWETNQDSNFVRFEKDTISIEGNYSLKIVPSTFTAWQECMSYSSTGIHLQTSVGENKSLTFFVKSVPDSTNQFESVFLRISGRFYVGGNFETDYEWETYERIDDFTKVQVPILNSDVDSLTIQIFGGALNGAADGCHNRSISWVDGIGIAETEIINSNSELTTENSKVLIFPNPSNGIIDVVQSKNKITNYQLYSLGGKLIEIGRLNGERVILKNRQKGIFVLILTNENQSFELSKKVKIE